MGRQVTLKDVADRCGVNVSTVSRALRVPGRHSAELTSRVIAAARELGYDPEANNGARQLIGRRFGREIRHQTVAVFMPELFCSTPYFWEAFSGLLAVFSAQGYAVLTVVNESEDRLPLSVRRGEIDGAIIAQNSPEVVNRLRSLPAFEGKALFSLSEQLPGLPGVGPDFLAGYSEIAQALYHSGRTPFLYPCSPKPGALSYGKFAAQYLGLRDGVLKAGGDPDREVIPVPMSLELCHAAFLVAAPVEEPENAKVPQLEFPELMGALKGTKKAVIMAPNDLAAAFIWRILSNAKIQVPGDVFLCGCDDSGDLRHLLPSPAFLTTLTLPLRVCGQRVAHKLLESLNQTTESATTEYECLPVLVQWRKSARS